MSSILIICENDEGNPLAFALKREGHIVKVNSRNEKVLGESINPSFIQNPHKMMDQFDLIVSYVPSYGGSKRTLGAGKFHARLHDMEYLSRIREVSLPDTSPEPRGHFRCFLTVYKNQTEMLPFHLLTLTYNRLCEGERGPKMQAGTVHRLLQSSKLYEEGAKPLLPLLQRVGFFGQLTLELILSNEELYVQALSPKPLFLQGLSELTRQSTFKLLWSLVSGEKIEARSDELSLCTTLSCTELNDYAYVKPEEKALPHVWLQSTQGSSGLLGHVSARGVNVKECQRRVLRTIGFCVQDPEVMYRSDIGEDAEERLQWLKEAGWLT